MIPLYLCCALLTFTPIEDRPIAFSTEPSISISQTLGARETLYLDPNNCPHLQKAYRNFVALLVKPQIAEETAFALTNYIASEVFYPANANDEAVLSIVHNPVMDLDAFVENHVGLCRHYAYVTAYFIDKLQNEAPPLMPKGKVSLVRKNFPRGKHVFCMYVSQDKSLKLIIDSMRGIVKKSLEHDSVRNDEGLSLFNDMIK